MKASQSDRKIIAGLGLAVTLLLAGLCLLRPVFLVFLDNKAYDTMVRSLPEGKPTGLVVAVDLDEQSLARWGQWPWPRYRLATLLGKIAAQKPLAVGLDMVWAEKDQLSPQSLLDQLKADLGLDARISGVPETLQDYDHFLARTLAQGPFVLGYFFNFGPAQAEAGAGTQACNPPALPLAWLKQPGAPRSIPVFSASGLICNLPELARAAGTAGFFNALPDTDGIMRRVPLLIKYKQNYYPCLGLGLAMKAIGRQKAVVVVDSGGPALLRAGPLRAPLGKKLTALINFRGPPGTMPRISAHQVLTSPAAAAGLRGKIAILGTTAAGLKDIRATPLGPLFPGLEVQTTIVDNLLASDFFTRPRWALGAELMAAVLTGLLVTGLLCFLRPVWCVFISLLLALSLAGGSYWLLAQHRTFYSPLMPLAILLANLGLLSLAKFFLVEKRRSFLKSAFSHYVSPQVVDSIIETSGGLSLSGEGKEVSILFADIRGFTAISENLPPSQVGELLKAYLTPMTRLITTHLGTVDKFIGDAIMAFWNAPLDVGQHQDRALTCALAMLAKLEEINQGIEASFGVRLKIGIGLHCGPVRVGNMGSEDLFDYTVIGDAVNLTARLESLTKQYGLSLLLSRDFRQSCGPGPVFQEVDRVRVVGKTQPVTIYTAHPADQAAAMKRELGQYREALALYAGDDYQTAGRVFEELAQKHGDTALYGIYAERCLALASAPPPQGWDHVFDLKQK